MKKWVGEGSEPSMRSLSFAMNEKNWDILSGDESAELEKSSRAFKGLVAGLLGRMSDSVEGEEEEEEEEGEADVAG